MSGNLRAFPDEHNALLQEMASLRQSIFRSLNRANSDIVSLVGRGGPLHCRQTSANVTALMRQVRADLIVPNNQNMNNLEDCLDSFIAGIDQHDQVAS